jgi:Tfp pilus assembly protein PilX
MIKNEKGSFLMEMLVVIFLLGFLGYGLMKSHHAMLQARARNIYHTLSFELAQNSLEELATVDPSTLSSASNSTENIVRANYNFVRTVEVNVNSDSSRTVDVTVTPVNAKLGSELMLSAIFAPW